MRTAVALSLGLFLFAVMGTSIAARFTGSSANGPAARTPAPPTQAGSTQAATVAPAPSPMTGEGLVPLGPPASTRTTAPPTATASDPPVPSSAPTQGLSYEVVAQHASAADWRIVVRDRAYDVTTYIRRHPGGAETITPWCGSESTVAFQTEDGVRSYSSRAYRDLETYFIGGLAK